MRSRSPWALAGAVAAIGWFGATCGEPPAAGDPDGGPPTDPDAGTAGTSQDAGPGADAAGADDAGPHDAGGTDAGAPPDGGGIGPLPSRGGVTTTGGTVDRLYFAVTGDTRPAFCDMTSSYPTARITRIATLMEARQPQFAVDAGDHIYVCFAGLTAARTQMGYYMTAIANFKAPFFMSMGNHECTLAIGNCPTGSSDSNYVAYLEALKPIAARAYYSIDVNTRSGLARFVVVADNSWDNDHATWLEATLAEADAVARYTILVRHHNLRDSFSGTNTGKTLLGIVRRHKHALHITGHTHTYGHDLVGDPSGRTVIIGTGGAPSPPFYGYGTVVQGLDDRLYFTMYDESTDRPVDAWSVGPN